MPPRKGRLERIPEGLVLPIRQITVYVHNAFQNAGLAVRLAFQDLVLDLVKGRLRPAGDGRRHRVLVPSCILSGPHDPEHEGRYDHENHNNDGRDPGCAVSQRCLLDIHLCHPTSGIVVQ